MAARIYTGVNVEVYSPYETQPGLEDEEAEIEKQFGKIVFRFPLLHHGWECDANAYVIQDAEGKHQLVLSDITDWFIADIDELKNKIEQYRKVLDLSEQALMMVEKDK